MIGPTAVSGDSFNVSAAKVVSPILTVLEFVLCFPIVLVLIFACVQFTHIWVARMVVHYAAYSAARAALVCTPGEYNAVGQRAAQQVCDWLGTDATMHVLRQNTPPVVTDDPAWNVTATVSEDLTLFAPIVGPIIAWGMNPWGASGWSTPLQTPANRIAWGLPGEYLPTITLTETVTLPKPYVTVVSSGL